MSIEKRIVGTFSSEQEVLYAIEGLKHQGYRETDMMVVAENRSSIPTVTSHTGVMVEADMQANTTLAGVMMNSYLTMMTGGMSGTKTKPLSRRLLERGLPEYTAKLCEAEINNGKIILLVDTNGVHEKTVYQEHYESETPRAVRLREEQLDIVKERVQVGELQVRKEVVEEQRTVNVPLLREEVYVERRPVIDGKVDGSPFTGDEIIRIPIIEERVEVMKRPVVVEEVIVGKRKIQETKQVQDRIKKEEARIERAVPSARVAEKSLYQYENSMENSDIVIVEGNPDIENVMAEVDKEETRAKRTGSLNITPEYNQQAASASNKNETSEAQTDTPVSKADENKSSAETPTAAKKEATQNNANPSVEKENKNNKNQKGQNK
ncbi:YsnF/AvaK domain-containing protein [Niallia sp. XMNu-256]|uniref:YsnF/AvaK domain-containing protein n=1 Tax=Niallia sp. XMNu-256 TaxID=3082444 RepID=UPI0030D59887